MATLEHSDKECHFFVAGSPLHLPACLDIILLHYEKLLVVILKLFLVATLSYGAYKIYTHSNQQTWKVTFYMKLHQVQMYQEVIPCTRLSLQCILVITLVF